MAARPKTCAAEARPGQRSAGLSRWTAPRVCWEMSLERKYERSIFTRRTLADVPSRRPDVFFPLFFSVFVSVSLSRPWARRPYKTDIVPPIWITRTFIPVRGIPGDRVHHTRTAAAARFRIPTADDVRITTNMQFWVSRFLGVFRFNQKTFIYS